jgi:hypothetical protein
LPISFPFALLTAPEKANILGSGIGLYVAYHLERYYRRRREVRSSLIARVTLIYQTSRQISRLYRPLSASSSSLNLDFSDEDEESGTQLLPLHNKPDTPPSALFPQNTNKKGKGRARSGSLALADVWDEREDLFGVGDDDDENEDSSEDGEEERPTPTASPAHQARQDTQRDAKPAKSVRWAEGSA